MIKTIFLIVGIVFAIMAYGIIVNVIEQVDTEFSDGGEFLDIQKSTQGTTLEISWRTDIEADGVVYYTVAGEDRSARSAEFKPVHSIKLGNLNGEVEFYIEACDMIGGCFESEKMTVLFP